MARSRKISGPAYTDVTQVGELDTAMKAAVAGRKKPQKKS